MLNSFSLSLSASVSAVSQHQSGDFSLRGFTSNSNRCKAAYQHGGTEEERESKDPAATRKSSSEMSRDLKPFFFLNYRSGLTSDLPPYYRGWRDTANHKRPGAGGRGADL